LGKQTANRHKSKEIKRKVEPGEAMHSDLCDCGERAWDGNRYLMVLKCEASGYSMPYFLKDKSGVYEALKMAIEKIKRETGNSMKYFRSDNGTEYVNEKVRSLLLENNIDHERSPPDVKQANGLAERENRTLMDDARTLLYDTDLDKGTQRLLWSEAVATTAYLRNRVPHKGNTEVTPYELWFGNKPDGRPLGTFGSVAFTRIPDHIRRKMDPKAKRQIFVGYDWKTTKIYRVYDPDDQKVHRVGDTQVEDLSHHQKAHTEEKETEAPDPDLNEVRIPLTYRTTECGCEQSEELRQGQLQTPSKKTQVSRSQDRRIVKKTKTYPSSRLCLTGSEAE
jgi:hypothetical protein